MKNERLTSVAINAASESVREFLKKNELEQKEIIRISLIVEEALINYQRCFGESQEFSLVCMKKMGVARVALSVSCKRFNPLVQENDEYNVILRNLFCGQGVLPSYQYINGCNQVSITLPKKSKSAFVNLGIAIILGIVIGMLSELLPDSVATSLSEGLITPLYDTFMGLLVAVSGPLIFFSIIMGVYGIGDVTTLGRVGKRIIGRFIAFTVILGVIFTACISPFFQIAIEGSSLSLSMFSDLLALILDMVPGNLITPFSEGQPMQIIFIGIFVGIALLILGENGNTTVSLVEQVNQIAQFSMGLISKMIPGFIFISVFNMFLTGQFHAAKASYKIVIFGICGSVLFLAFYTIYYKIKFKSGTKTFLNKVKATDLIAFTTASNAAALVSNMEACEKKLGIEQKLVNFAVPLGQIVFMPGAVILFITSSLCMAESYSVPIDISWIIILIIMSTILAIAAPPIPGGSLTCFTILFVQLGVPIEALPVTLLINSLLEFVVTGVNIYCLQAELTIVSDSLDMLDRECLMNTENI